MNIAHPFPTSDVQSDVRKRWEKLRLHPTQTYTLERCKQLIADDEKEIFKEERINWIKAIGLHSSQAAIEIATLLFEWYFANEETERIDVLRIWQQLLKQAGDSLGATREAAIILRQISIIQVSRGNFDDAREYLLRSTAIGEKIQDQILIGNNYYELGLIYRNAGRYKQALDSFINATKLSKETGNTKALLYSEGQRANLLAVQGNFTEAIHILKESIEAWQQFSDINDRNMAHTTLHTLGNIYLQNGEPAKAVAVLQESLFLKERGKERFDLIVRTRTILAEAYLRQGQFEMAKHYLIEADVESCAKMGSYLYAATAFKTLSQIYFLQQNFPQSQRLANRALDVAKQSNNPLITFDVLLWIFSAKWRQKHLLQMVALIPILLKTLLKIRVSPHQFLKLALRRLSYSLTPLRSIRNKLTR